MNRLLIPLTLLFVFASCATKLSLDQNYFDLPTNGTSIIIHIDVNKEWAAESDASWCSINPSHGDKSIKEIKVSVQDNTTYDDRNCTITITSQDKVEKVEIKQHQSDAILAETSHVSISDVEQTFTVNVSSNVEYEVKTDQAWVKHTDTKALATKTLSFYAEANTSINSRSASITISQLGGTVLQVIQITQKQRDVLEVASNNIVLDWDGTSKDVPVTSNVDYSIEVPENPDWLVVEKTGKGNETKLKITASEFIPSPDNMSPSQPSDRSCTIKLKFEDLEQTIRVEQKFKDFIWLERKELNAYLNYETTLTCYAYFHDGINNTLKYTISDPSIASVNSGIISPLSIGQATITVSNDDKTYSATCLLNVKDVVDDIYVVATGKSMIVTGGYVSMVFHSNIHYPSEIKNIVFNSVMLCHPSGAVYDIQNTSDGYVQFKPIVVAGYYSSALSAQYSNWYVVYQTAIDGVAHEFRSNLNANVWSGNI